MQAVVIDQPGSFGVTSIEDPTPGPGSIVVAPRATGICGTDLHIIDGHFPPAPYPLVPGHEFAGDVVALGSGVDGVREGDRVAVDPSLFCGHCRYCRRGRGNLCESWGAIGDTVGGAFAEYVAVPAANAYRIGSGVSYEAGALIEPLSCVVHGLRRLAVPSGSELLIVGAGTIGLLMLQAAVRSGAAQVSVVDPDAERRALALTLGARAAAGSAEELLGDRPGFEYVVEATGVPAAGEAALAAVGRGGTMLVFGVAPEEARLAVSPFRVYNDEITILGSMAVLESFEPALRLMDAGAIDVASMVTHRYDLQGFGDAVQAVRSRAGLKVQIDQSGAASNGASAH
jgi:2-desacetyl-2-hydroxyethyl bacteriochlorophyllide A dehydrogenase